jgi:hypothetical protein
MAKGAQDWAFFCVFALIIALDKLNGLETAFGFHFMFKCHRRIAMGAQQWW